MVAKVKQFRPMKAVSEAMGFNDITYPKVASVKLDGVYAVNKNGALLGRSLKALKNVWITELLGKDIFKGFVGEILNAKLFDKGDLRINRQNLCANTTSCTSTVKLEGWSFVWALFDYVGDASEEYCSTPYINRMETLLLELAVVSESNELIELEGGFKYHYFKVGGIDIIVPVMDFVEDAEELSAKYDKSVQVGHEGMVAREPEGIFKFGRSTKKSQEIVRFKPTGDSEIIVTAFEPMFENNNEAKVNELGYTERSSHQENKVQLDMVGALIGIDINTGETVKIGAGKLDHAEREDVWKNQVGFLGRLAKYQFMDTGIKDKPRHPRWVGWRDITDVDPSVVELAKEKGVVILK